MAGEQDGRAGPVRQGAQEGPHLGHAVGVQAIGRLVEDQDGRGAEQSARDAKALAHAERIVGHPAAGVVGHLDDGQDAADLGAVEAQQAPGQVEVFLARQVAVKAVRLEQGAGPAGGGEAVTGDVDAVDQGLTGGRPDEAQQHPEGRGLARAVAPQKAVDGPPRDRERHLVHSGQAAEAAAKAAGLDGVFQGITFKSDIKVVWRGNLSQA